MMGNHSRSESLFYYFRLEDQVPENHLLRLIDKHVCLRQQQYFFQRFSTSVGLGE
jgi:transposase